MICASESAVFIDEPIYESDESEIRAFPRLFRLPERKAPLGEVHVWRRKRQTWRREWQTQSDVAGMSPSWIAEKSGFKVPEGTSIIGVELSKVGPEEPLSREKLSPVLGFYKVKDSKEGFALARRCWNSAVWP
jgi:acetaldehyde dehydrogenase/alcohol dehydrogenase